MIKRFYLARTTFLGADGPSEFYFDTSEKAKKYISQQANGEVEEVTVECEKLNYFDGCTYNDLTAYDQMCLSDDDD